MPEKERTLLGDVGNVWARRKEIWRLISRADKLGFISGVLIMSLAAAIETGIAIDRLRDAHRPYPLSNVVRPGSRYDSGL